MDGFSFKYPVMAGITGTYQIYNFKAAFFLVKHFLTGNFSVPMWGCIQVANCLFGAFPQKNNKLLTIR
jgi:hypothetical protein